MKASHAALVILATTLTGQAQVTYDSGVLPGGSIPDNGSPALFSQTISGSGIASIAQVQVQISITGNPVGQGWAGDIVASLNYNYGSQTAVLLNQPGVSGGSAAGFGYDGWTVTISDGLAGGDIHLGQPTVPDTILTGIWEPDGRLNPTDTLRPAMLSVFNGLPGDGTWSLSLSDVSPGGTMALNSWSIQIKAVPEPGSTMLALCGLMGVLAARRRLFSGRP